MLQGQGRGSQTSTPQTVLHSQSGINPRQLLDPKGSNIPQHKPYTKPIHSDLPDKAPQKLDSEEPEGQGMGNLIERVHGITQREERPRKRQKTGINPDEDDEQKKATFQGGGKGTEIGEYMREKRKEAQADSGSNGTVIDLTAGVWPLFWIFRT